MPGLTRPILLSSLLTILSCSLPLFSADPPAGRNSDPTYQQLRNVTLSGDAVTVTNLSVRRDAATFHLRSGTVCFLPKIHDKVTGAVFVGDGNFVLDPPIP